MKLLHLDSSILGDYSASRQLTASIVAKLQAADPALQYTYRDLAANPIGHLSGAHLAAAQNPTGDQTPELANDLALGAQVLQEFLDADTVVIGVALYNFTISTQLKAWIDRVLVAGKTFRYTAEGALEGLAGNKRVILAVARGGARWPLWRRLADGGTGACGNLHARRAGIRWSASTGSGGCRRPGPGPGGTRRRHGRCAGADRRLAGVIRCWRLHAARSNRLAR